MVKNITAKLSRSWDGKPLAVLDSEPFNGMAAQPSELLALAMTLIKIAQAATEHSSAPRYVSDKRISIEVENV